MNTRTPKAEWERERRMELVAQPPRKPTQRRPRKHVPQAAGDPAYGCVDWFEYRAAEALEGEEDAQVRCVPH
ncbi:MAG TPA: hypothetical protein VIN61_17815 [Gammaproteobacteria bacterium]